MTKEGTVWETRLLRIVFGLNFLLVSVIAIGELLQDPKPIFFDNLLIKGSPTLFTFISGIAFFLLTRSRYVLFLLLFILSFHFCFQLLTLGHELGDLRLLPESRVGAGRWMDFIFVSFPLFAIMALFFTRPWAIVLWLLLSLITPIKQYFLIVNNPFTYFTNEYELALKDGNAILLWRLEDNATSILFLMIIILALVFFNRYVLRVTQKAERSNAMLSRYFSPEIKEEIESANLSINNQNPKYLDVAILFTDIVGFTAISESMKPNDVLTFLSEYQTIMIDAIFKNQGTVDKFIGDAVMANFGTPKSYGNDAQNAFNCGVLMNENLKIWNRKRKEKGLQEIKHRIGIHFGPCVAGNIGSEQRKEFAIIGDPVNVASRICDACKQFDTNFIISKAVDDKIKKIAPSKIEKNFEIRGRKEKLDLVKIYT